MLLIDLFSEFLDDCYLRGLSAKTIYGYRYNINLFFRFNDYSKLTLDAVTKKHIAAYQRYLLDKGIAVILSAITFGP